jgi:hypothetical protein
MGPESSEFQLLATAANYIKKDLQKEKNEWVDSPFKWIINLPPGTKGKLGIKLIQQWCALKGLSIDKSPDSEADLLINNHRVEVKLSTLWKKGIYKFQQIRDQNYEYIICLGISPHDAHCWVISKKKLKEKVIGHMGQHTGKEGKETSWLTIQPKNPPEWINYYGGSLSEAFEIIKKLSR